MLSYLSPNLIRIPKRLESVTARAEEAAPEAVGLPEARREAIWSAVERLYRSRTYPGVSLSIRYRGKRIIDRCIGHARGNGPRDKRRGDRVPMTPQTPVCLFSASKAITAMLVHKLAEEGLIQLDAPVAEYVPEFAAKGKQYITVGDVLSHKGGIPSIEQKRPDPSILWDWDACVQTLCNTRARGDAGVTQAYHAVTGGFILGEVMRRVTGEELNTILDERIRQPMGFRHFRYGLPADEQPDSALNYFTGLRETFPLSLAVKRALGGPFRTVCEVSNAPEFMNAVIPAGNVYATASEACDFFQCLLNGGAFNGRRVFERRTVTRAIREASPRQFDRTLLVPLRASEGFMLGDTPFGLYGPDTRASFGHLGFINIFCWADPRREIAVSLLTTGKPIIAPHIGPLIGLLRAINNAFPKDAG